MLVLVGVLATACGGGGGGDAAAPGPSSPTTAVSTTPTSDPTADVEAAYLAHRQMFQRLLESPDPDDPELEQRLTGEALDALRNNLRNLNDAKQALRFGPQYTFEAVSIDIQSDKAVVRECVVDEARLVDETTNEVLEAAAVSLVVNEISMRHDDNNGWRVFRIQQVGELGERADCVE